MSSSKKELEPTIGTSGTTTSTSLSSSFDPIDSSRLHETITRLKQQATKDPQLQAAWLSEADHADLEETRQLDSARFIRACFERFEDRPLFATRQKGGEYNTFLSYRQVWHSVRGVHSAL